MDLNTLFQGFNNKKVLIVGDAMIDAYMWGEINRMSPEAPVPVVEVKKHENRLGGAANVALNLKALGATPILCSVVGTGNRGVLFKELMKESKLSTAGILSNNKRKTTIFNQNKSFQVIPVPDLEKDIKELFELRMNQLSHL